MRRRAGGPESARLSLLKKELHFSIYQNTSSVMIEGVQLLRARFTRR